MLNIEKTFLQKFPNTHKSFKRKTALKILKAISHEEEINSFVEQHPHLKGAHFIDKAFEHFNFSFMVNSQCLERIPATGRVIIVANHPIGTLDGMALIKMVKNIRPDVKMVTNDVLQQIEPFQELFLSVDNMDPKAQHKAQYQQMIQALQQEQALVIFPAGEVSRLSPKGIRDGDWKTGFIRLSQKTNSPILPVYIGAKNSFAFYSLSMLYRPLGTLMLVHEMFNKNNQEIELRIGKMIPWESIREKHLSHFEAAQLIKCHTYSLKKSRGKPKKSDQTCALHQFKTVNTISYPSCRQAIRQDLANAEHLMTTPTGLDLYVVDFKYDSAIIKELGRVREIAFREVGEGTGNQGDIDIYDQHFRHLILWDDDRLEIAGAYRLGECHKLMQTYGKEALYSSHIFDLKDSLDTYLKEGLELGRCFVQPAYWNTRALDYLWYGMGNYLSKHPNIRYLFGSVSISNSYSERARQLIVAFYNCQFGTETKLAHAKCPFKVSESIEALAQKEFTGEYHVSFKRLNELLEAQGEKLPMLFKQYVGLCDKKGCRFLDFHLAHDFSFSIGALMMVDITTIKPQKRRYLNPPKGRSSNSHPPEAKSA